MGSQPLPTVSVDEVESALPRPRSGTWSAKDAKKEKHDKNKSKKQEKSNDSRRKDKIQAGSRSGSTSRYDVDNVGEHVLFIRLSNVNDCIINLLTLCKYHRTSCYL